MAKLNTRKFKPTPEEIEQGAVPLEQIEILEALKKYKTQNPAKYEAKKEALFARYGFTLEDAPKLDVEPDESDLELEELTKKTKKAK